MKVPIPGFRLTAVIALILCSKLSFGQCDARIDYSQRQKSKTDYSVYLKSDQVVSGLKVQLYDLIQGKVVQEKILASLTSGSQEVFTKVTPSTYTIFVTIDMCKKSKSLGGITGIKIGESFKD